MPSKTDGCLQPLWIPSRDLFHLDLTIFGSSVFDLDQSNDLDIFGEDKHFKLLISSLECFFELVHVPNQTFRYGIDDYDSKDVTTYQCRYSLLGWVGDIPKEIETMGSGLSLD